MAARHHHFLLLIPVIKDHAGELFTPMTPSIGMLGRCVDTGPPGLIDLLTGTPVDVIQQLINV